MEIKVYGNIIQHNSLKHYIYYFLADKHISAFQFFGVPETPFLWKLEELGIIKKKKIFLQHGITKEMLPFLQYENTKYRLFVCGARPEYEYIREKFGYPSDNVKYLGFCRFDNLHEFIEKKQILVMPTWRQWLGMTNKDTNVKEDRKKFKNSDYYTVYSSLINNVKLQKLLEKNNYELIFYPHPEMQRFIDEFMTEMKNVRIADRKKENLQELMKTSKIIITDYSSISFDCGYMNKLLIYYQFDEKLYHSKHFKKGYFDAKRDGFGPVVENENDLLCILSDYIKRESMEESYKIRAKEFFQIRDSKNSERNYYEIKNL